MELINKLKMDLLCARKSKAVTIVVTLLTPLIGDAEKVGKDKGNRLPTDEEVVAVIKKFIAGAKENLKYASEVSKRTYEWEIRFLEAYLPAQLSRGEIFDIIHRIPSTEPFTLPALMAYFKTNYAGRYDGKELSSIIKDILAK